MDTDTSQRHDIDYIIKTTIIATLLFIESVIITTILRNFIQQKHYLTFDSGFIVNLSVYLLLLVYTFALSIGAWDKWKQYIIVPVPIALGLAINFIKINFMHALLVFSVSMILLIYNIHYATFLRNQLIKFRPRIILKHATKGILMVYAIAASLMILTSSIDSSDINLSKMIGDVAEYQVESYLHSQEQTSVSSAELISNNIGNTLETQAERALQPYEEYIVPVISILVFGTVQFLNTFIYWIFALTISPIIWFAKKTHFLKTGTESVDREILKY